MTRDEFIRRLGELETLLRSQQYMKAYLARAAVIAAWDELEAELKRAKEVEQ